MSDSSGSKPGIYVISGPSGVGKSTITREVVRRCDDVYLSVSCTTRPRSSQEVDGRDYWFISKERFEQGIGQGRFLEWAQVYGNYYGTDAQQVGRQLEQGKNVVLEIDVQGGRQVKQARPEAVLIFIMPPDAEQLARRIYGRGRDPLQVVRTRLKGAEEEIAQGQLWYDRHVVNDDLKTAIEKVIDIIHST